MGAGECDSLFATGQKLLDSWSRLQESGPVVVVIEDVQLELTFDPPWTPDKMSDDAKFILGFG